MDCLDSHAPFTHIIRNAVDHGLETEDERVASGKPASGTVLISLEKTEKTIELSITDDGKGLDYEAISRKAEEIGLINKGEPISDSAIVDLLFMSGVSTAEKVSDVSGRGVGMDVVKKNVEAAGGKITIRSEKGAGSTFSISLPTSVSTQIMDGFLVKAGGETYVLPMDNIGESFEIKAENRSTIEGKGEVVLRREELLPIIRLSRDLKWRNEEYEVIADTQNNLNSENIAISIDFSDRRYALCVDEIIGVQKVVVRDINGLLVEKQYFDGAAVLGDGSVAMIIGSDGLGCLVH